MIFTQRKTSNFHWFLGLGIVFIVVGLILGGTVSVGAAEKVTLECWYQTSIQHQMENYRFPGFLEKHPELKIEYITSPSGTDLVQKFLIRVIGGQELPDIVESMGYSSQIMMKLASYVDLSERVAPYVDGFSPATIRQLSTPDGKLRQLANYAGGIVGRFYRKDVYDKFGLTLAETYDELIENGKKFKAQGWTNFSLVAERDDWWSPRWFRMFASQAGSGMFDRDGNLVLDSPKAIEGMKMLKKIYDSGITMDLGSYWSPAWYESLKGEDGPIASHPGNFNWLQGAIMAKAITPRHFSYGKWRWTYLPAFYKDVPQSRYASELMGGAGSHGILAHSKHQDLAWELVKYAATSPKAAIDLYRAEGAIAGYVPILKDPEYRNVQFDLIGGQKPAPIVSDMLKNQFDNCFLPAAWNEILKPLGIEVSRILRGEIGVEEGLKQFAQKVRTDILPKYPEYAK